MSYLLFESIPKKTPDAKTDRWVVKSHGGSDTVGWIVWFSNWRKYVFIPPIEMEVRFDEDCLREIAKFIEEHTALHKQK